MSSNGNDLHKSSLLLSAGAESGLSWEEDPLWYKDAIIYELHA